MKILFIGTSSGAGKTMVTAMFCRHLRKNGINVAPFKASNLSLNSYATKDCKEIGMGQAFQALASGLEPESDMNPVLLKPSGDGRMQLIVNGTPYKDSTQRDPSDTQYLLDNALSAYDRLSKRYDAVIAEGSGSPAEINLADRDIANMRLARERNIPVILIGDIERGGVFAGLYGTWKLIDESDRHLIKGFVINRFRGDPSILRSGTERIEEMTGMRFLGVMPLADLRFPDEDSLSPSKGRLSGIDVKAAYIENIDEFLSIAEEHLDLDSMLRIAKG